MGAIPFETDLGVLVAFDPEVLRPRARDASAWWRDVDAASVPEVAEGRAAILPLGHEGAFRCALRVGAATAEEERLTVGRLEGLGLEVTSGEVFVGAAERLPGDGKGERILAIPGTGAHFPVEPGRWSLEVRVLDWREDDAFYDEDNEPLASAPADFLLLVTPRAGDADVPLRFPQLLELLPQREATASARVPRHVRRPPSAAQPGPGRRRGGGSAPELEPYVPPPLARAPEARGPFSWPAVRAAFREVLAHETAWGPHPPARLAVATVAFRPRDRTLLAHDVAVDALLEKATRIREQLRVLEAKVNADDRLDGFEQAGLQIRVTGVYEALDELLGWVARAGG